MNLAPIDVIGFSTGGWAAAEMAVANAKQFRKMVLVAPPGIKPPEGEIMDIFAVTIGTQLNATVHDAEATPEFASFTAVSVRRSSSRPSRMREPRRHESHGIRSCTIPACRIFCRA